MKKIWIVFLLGCLMMAPGMAAAQPYRISVSQFVEHPALDAVLKGFQDYLAEEEVDARYQIHIAQANMATAGQIGTQIMGEFGPLVTWRIALGSGLAFLTAQLLAAGAEVTAVELDRRLAEHLAGTFGIVGACGGLGERPGHLGRE